jgi:hypothetical protein
MYETAKTAAAVILRRVMHGRIDCLGGRRVLVNVPPRPVDYARERRLERVAGPLRDAGWEVEVTALGVEAVQPTTVDVPFISPAMVRAARDAAALDHRIGGPDRFTTLTIKVGLGGTGWGFHDAILDYADGGALIVSPFREVDERSPFADTDHRRYAGAEELRRHLTELPFNGEALPIPLHAAH